MNSTSDGANDELPNINFLYKTMLARDPSKRRVKPTPTADLLPLALESESEDSDFKIEENESGDDDSDFGSSVSEEEEEEEEEEEKAADYEEEMPVPSEETTKTENGPPQTADVKARTFELPEGVILMRYCCICLGSHSSDANEIVECDSCGILVHEGCYGVTESSSISSTASSCSTEPWFCEPCQANVQNPSCQLCPNYGGAFKETDTGLWVHLVCALYIPGIAFGEVDRLTQVTLFEMQYTKWGLKACSLCQDPWLSRTGVCIGCDAGMCRSYFHVTCAQREGLLSEAYGEDALQADPFYANCKLHTERTTMRRRISNYLSIQRHMQRFSNNRQNLEKEVVSGTDDGSLKRVLRKLDRKRRKFCTDHWPRATWVPTQKMPRLLTTSASAVRRLRHKAELMGVDTEALELKDSQAAALAELPRKWHLPPAFTVEFVGYATDRERRISSLKQQVESMKTEEQELEKTEQELRRKHDELLGESGELTSRFARLKTELAELNRLMSVCAPKRRFTVPDFTRTEPPKAAESVDNSKFPRTLKSPAKNDKKFAERFISVADNSNMSSQDIWVANIQDGNGSLRAAPISNLAMNGEASGLAEQTSPRVGLVLKRVPKSLSPRREKKRKKSKSGRSEKIPKTEESVMTPTSSKTSAEVPKITIKIKPVPKAPPGFPFIFSQADSEGENPGTPPQLPHKLPQAPSPATSAAETSATATATTCTATASQTPVSTWCCCVCGSAAQKSTSVSCDNCSRVFDFTCLDPPVKKTPKQRGYSWHCADCDSPD